MSGKQDKKSRRLQAVVNSEVNKSIQKIETAKLLSKRDTIIEYNIYLRTMSFYRRFRFGLSVILAIDNY